MPKYLSPTVVEGELALEAGTTVAQAITTIFTFPDKDDNNGALYRADVYVRVNTLDGGTTPTLTIALTATEGGSARTMIVPMANEAGTYTAAGVITLAAASSFNGGIVFRADKNTAFRWTRTAGGTPDNAGNFDVFIVVTRYR